MISFPKSKRDALGAAFFVTLAAPLPALAQTTDPAPTILDLIAPNRIATFIANTGIAALRTLVEIEYAHLSTDVMRGTVSMSGVVIRPQLPWDQAGQCEVTIDRVTLNSDITQSLQDVSDMSLDLIGTTMTLACLEREIALPLRSAGFSAITLDQGRVALGYVHATGETALEATLAINDFATLDLSGSGMILPRLGSYGYLGDPAFRVTRAVASLQDNGAWAALSAMLPGNLRDPEMVREMGTEALTQALSDGGLRPLSAVERNFVTQLMGEVARFVADPGEITIEAALPGGGVVVEPDSMDDPATLIGALALQAREVPLARAQLLRAADIDGAAEDPARALRLARALIAGEGVPRAPALVPDLLAPLAAGEGPQAAEAAGLIAAALEASDPRRAYELALHAGAAGVAGAVATLDRIEARMTTDAVIAAQDSVFGSRAYGVDLAELGDDPRELRTLALAHLTGNGQPRNYPLAYLHALLADAAGDVGAAALITEVEARFANRGPEVDSLWRGIAPDLQAEALALWVDLDLGARYRRD